jgi:hypothetical protein
MELAHAEVLLCHGSMSKYSHIHRKVCQWSALCVQIM